MDTAQPHLPAADPVNALNEAAEAFKAYTTPPPALPPRAEDGKFTRAEVDEVVEEAEAPIEDADEAEVEVEAAEEAQPEDVDMPSSWGNDDAETWLALPAEAKAKIAEREAQRDTAVNLKFQEAANARKQAEAIAAEANVNRDRFKGELDVLIGTIQPQLPPRELLDPNSQYYDPDRFHLMKAEAEDQTRYLDGLRAQRQEIAAQEAREEAAAFARYEEEARPKLFEAVPDLQDPIKAPTILAEIAQYAVSLGIEPDMLPKANSTEVATLWKAMQYDRQKLAKAAVKATPKPAAPALKAGVPQSRHASQRASLQRDMDRLTKTGSVEAGAAIFKRYL